MPIPLLVVPLIAAAAPTITLAVSNLVMIAGGVFIAAGVGGYALAKQFIPKEGIIKAVFNRMREKQIQEMRTMMEQAEAHLKDINKVITEATKDMSHASDNLQKAASDIAETSETFSEHIPELQDANAHLSTTAAALASASEEIALQIEKQQNLSNKLLAKEEEFKQLQITLARIKNDFDINLSVNAEQSTSIKVVIDANKLLMEENAQLIRDLQQVKNEYGQLIIEHTLLSDENAVLTNNNAVLTSSIGALTDENAVLKENGEKKSRHIDVLTVQLDKSIDRVRFFAQRKATTPGHTEPTQSPSLSN